MIGDRGGLSGAPTGVLPLGGLHASYVHSANIVQQLLAGQIRHSGQVVLVPKLELILNIICIYKGKPGRDHCPDDHHPDVLRQHQPPPDGLPQVHRRISGRVLHIHLPSGVAEYILVQIRI